MQFISINDEKYSVKLFFSDQYFERNKELIWKKYSDYIMINGNGQMFVCEKIIDAEFEDIEIITAIVKYDNETII